MLLLIIIDLLVRFELISFFLLSMFLAGFEEVVVIFGELTLRTRTDFLSCEEYLEKFEARDPLFI